MWLVILEGLETFITEHESYEEAEKHYQAIIIGYKNSGAKAYLAMVKEDNSL
jgi:hypothetical protein